MNKRFPRASQPGYTSLYASLVYMPPCVPGYTHLVYMPPCVPGYTHPGICLPIPPRVHPSIITAASASVLLLLLPCAAP